MDNMEGKRLRELREKVGISMAEMHRLTGVSYASIQDWEGGRYRPHPLAFAWLEAQLKLKEVERLIEEYELKEWGDLRKDY